jgi:hypothetical protein
MPLPPLLLGSARAEKNVGRAKSEKRETENGRRKTGEERRKSGRREAKRDRERGQKQRAAEINELFFWRRDAFFTQELLKRGEP